MCVCVFSLFVNLSLSLHVYSSDSFYACLCICLWFDVCMRVFASLCTCVTDCLRAFVSDFIWYTCVYISLSVFFLSLSIDQCLTLCVIACVSDSLICVCAYVFHPVYFRLTLRASVSDCMCACVFGLMWL